MSIQVDALDYSYGREPVLRGLSLDFQPGITVLLGPNASGKSTLIKCLAGLLKTEGSIQIDDVDIANMSHDQRAETVSYLPQQGGFDAAFTVFEYVLLGRLGELAWRPSTSDLIRVSDILAETELTDLGSRRIDQLSGGQQKMAAIAQALVREPAVLLLDEPTNNLDYSHQFTVFEMVRDMTRKRRTTTVIAIHDLNMATAYADQVAVLHNGALRGHGDPGTVITPELVRDVYGIEVEIIYQDGAPLTLIPKVGKRA